MHLTLQYKVSARHSLSSSELQTSLIVNEAFISLLRIHNAGLSNKVSKGTFMTLTGLMLQASQSTITAYLNKFKFNEMKYGTIQSSVKHQRSTVIKIMTRRFMFDC